MQWQTIETIQQSYQSGEYTPQELVQFYLDRIASHDAALHAYLSVWDDDARTRAQVSHERIAKKQARALEGIPIALKDNICTKGKKTTAGSRILKDYTAVYSATVVKQLEDAGAIILGKTNLDEFAMGSSTEFSGFGATKNPHDTSRVPGGSSGGSATAVAADLAAAALGSDTGGSIRQPAGFCGVVGFKPTYGRVSRYGLIAMSSSLDQIGPLAKSVRDARMIYDVIHGYDPKDATTTRKHETHTPRTSLQDKKFCIPASFEKFEFDVTVKKEFQKAVAQLEERGAIVERLDIPHIDASLPVYYLIVTSEISSNLARYDGIRYGTKVDAAQLLDTYINSRKKGFGEEAKRRIILGTFTLSEGYREKYYKQAMRVKHLIMKELDQVFANYDAILSPTTPTVPFVLGEKYDDPLTMYLSDLFTVSANIANLPAISLPLPSTTLPVGLQLMGKRFSDTALLTLAEDVEEVFGRGHQARTKG